MKIDIKNRNRFSNWAKRYDRDLLQTILFQKVHKEIFKQISFFIQTKQRILDIACGTGLFASFLFDYNKKLKISGIDNSPGMIKTARKKKSYIDWKVACAEKIPYEDNTFDVVTCTTAFHHFQDQQKSIEEMYRVLKPGGIVVIVDGDVNRFLGWVIYKIFIKIQERRIYHQYAYGMKKLLKTVGFVNIKQNHFNFFVPCLLTMGVKSYEV